MRSNRPGLPILLLLGSLTLGSCISLPTVGLYRGGGGAPSTEIVGLNGARAANVSFQNIGSSAARPVVVPLESGSFAALQLMTPTQYSLVRMNESLSPAWATPYTSPESGGGLAGLMATGGLTMPADAPLLATRADGKIGLLSARRLTGDSVHLIARIFDEKSGKLERESTVFRLKETGELDPTRATTSAVASPNGSVVAVWTPVAMNNDKPAKFDVEVLGADLSVRGKGTISVESEERSERFAGMLVNNAGDVFAVTRNESGLVAVTKHPLVQGGAPTRLMAKITVEEAYKTALKDIGFGLDGDNSVYAILGGIDTDHDDNAVGVATARFDFASGSVPTSKYMPITEELIEQIFQDEDDFEAAVLQSVRPIPGGGYVAIFEQRGVRESTTGKDNREKSAVGMAENVMLLGLDREGNLKWRQGFRKSQRLESAANTDNIIKAMYRDGSADRRSNESTLFYTLSMNTAVGRDGNLKIAYPEGDKIYVREYRAADGEAVGGGKEREVLKVASTSIGGGSVILRPTISWIGDRSFVVSVFERSGLTGGGDMKLVRVDY